MAVRKVARAAASNKPAKAAKASPPKRPARSAKRPVSKRAAKAVKPAPAPESAQTILKNAKPTKLNPRRDTPTPPKGKGKQPLLAKELLRHVKPAAPDGVTRDQATKPIKHAKELLKQLNKQQFRFNRAASTATFEEQAFMDFFGPEIEQELEQEATIFNDRFARWPCQCCDVVIRVPRRTEVFHGDYHLVHDDILGLLVNGERWVPNAETPIEVFQPGRVRNPWTGEVVKPGKHAV